MAHPTQRLFPTVAQQQRPDSKHRHRILFEPVHCITFETQVNHAPNSALDRTATTRNAPTAKRYIPQLTRLATFLQVANLFLHAVAGLQLLPFGSLSQFRHYFLISALAQQRLQVVVQLVPRCPLQRRRVQGQADGAGCGPARTTKRRRMLVDLRHFGRGAQKRAIGESGVPRCTRWFF